MLINWGGGHPQTFQKFDEEYGMMHTRQFDGVVANLSKSKKTAREEQRRKRMKGYAGGERTEENKRRH